MLEFKPGTYGYIAQKDLDVACDLVQKHPSTSAFHSHQAIEKILKQDLLEVVNGAQGPVMRTHNLRRLVKGSNLPALSMPLTTMYEFADVYFDSRYPSEDFYEITADDAERFCLTAQTVYLAVCTEIKRRYVRSLTPVSLLWK